jgi:hypothetical protein
MRFGASANVGVPSATGEKTLPVSRRVLRRSSRKSWNTVPTRTVICSWSYAATSGATGQQLYLGKTNDPESTLVTKRTESSGEYSLPVLPIFDPFHGT